MYPRQSRPFAALPDWQRVEQPPGGDELPPEGADVLAELQRVSALLELILAELRGQVQQGIVYTVTTPVVSTTTPLEVSFGDPLFSITLINDGAGTVLYRIPNRSGSTWISLVPTEVQTFNFIKPIVTSVAFLAAVGPASVRIIGAY